MVFRSEIELLQEEGLDITKIAYSDNTDVLQLMDHPGKPPGILQYLEEQCLLSKGTDEVGGAAT